MEEIETNYYLILCRKDFKLIIFLWNSKFEFKDRVRLVDYLIKDEVVLLEHSRRFRSLARLTLNLFFFLASLAVSTILTIRVSRYKITPAVAFQVSDSSAFSKVVENGCEAGLDLGGRT